MQEVNECFKNVKKDYLKFLNKEKILGKSKAEKIKILKKVYIPTSLWIERKYKEKGKTLFLGCSGGQGSGKTTVSKILKIILTKYFRKRVCVISIDDFYKTLKERNFLSKNKHYLLKTRGVPGTHDIDLIYKMLRQINKKKFNKIILPKFDKSIDDRIKKNQWQKLTKKPDIIILEGWCVGAKAQSDVLLKKPVNDLEKFEDPNLIWRKYVNKLLRTNYKKLFNKMNGIIYLKAPSFSLLKKWRFKQEKKLKFKNRFKKNLKIMSYLQILRFMMFYQRITLQMFKDLPKAADVILHLNEKHRIKKIQYNT